MKRMLQLELKRGIYSAGFYVSILLIALAGIMGSGELAENLVSVGFLEGELRFMILALRQMSSESFCLMLPVACTLVASASYLEDLQSGTLRYILLRTTKNRYRWSKMLGCAIFGGLVVLIAILIVLGIAFARCPLNTAEIEQMKHFSAGYYISFLQRVLILCLNGAFFSLFGGAIATLVNNRYMAYAAPFIFYYVISTLFDAYLTGWRLINPREWVMVNSSPPGLILLILVGVNVIGAIVYLIIMERRWRDE